MLFFSSFVVGFSLYWTLLGTVTMQGVSKLLRQTSREFFASKQKKKYI